MLLRRFAAFVCSVAALAGAARPVAHAQAPESVSGGSGAPSPTVLVIGFRSEASVESRDDWMPVAIEEFLTWRLRRSGVLTVSPTVRAYQARRELSGGPETAVEWSSVADALGAACWIRGVCSGTPDQLLLDVERRDRSAAEGAASSSARFGPGRFNDVLDEATRWALAQLEVPSLDKARHDVIFAPPSRSGAALENFARAVRAIRDEQTRDAVRYIGQAVDLDPLLRPAQLLFAQLEVHMNDRARANAAMRLRSLRELARSAGDTLDLAQIEVTEGLLLASSGSHTVAAQRLENALRLATELGDVYTRIAAMTNLCDVFLSRRADAESMPADEAALRAAVTANLREAARWQEAVLSELERLGDRVSIAPAANKLALICERLGEPERALALHQRTIEAARACGSARTEATGWMFLGQFQRSQGKLDEALASVERCLTLAEAGARPGVLIALGDVLRDLKRTADALARYEEANRALLSSEDMMQQVICLRRIAESRDTLGDRPAALEALREAYDIAHALRLPEEDDIRQQMQQWGGAAP